MKTPLVAALKIGTKSVTALVGELQRDGRMCILGKGEVDSDSSETGKGPNEECVKAALFAAEDQAQASIYNIHLVAPCLNIQSLVTKGSIPVLTSTSDAEIRRLIALINGTDYQVDDVVFSGYCGALAVTTTEQRDQGVAAIDISDGILALAAFVEGKLATLDAIKMTGKVDAKVIQCAYQSLERAGVLRQMSAGVFLTGQEAMTQGLPRLAETTFGMKCVLGVPLGYTGLDAVLNQPHDAACLGMIRYAYTDGLSNVTRASSLLMKKIKKVFRG